MRWPKSCPRSCLADALADSEASMSATAAENAPAPVRYHPRVSSNLMVTVQTPRRAIVVKARDPSMNGLFLSGVPGFGERQVTVNIPLPNGQDIVTQCEVTRSQRD